ncbi:MAG: purine-nucleoside phosphorylase [Nitrospirota bacterium]
MSKQPSLRTRPSKISDRLSSSLRTVRKRIARHKPEIGIILGSGLGLSEDSLADAISIPYTDIEGFPVKRKGHDGSLLIGSLGNRGLAILQRRFHLYEGYDVPDLAYPVNFLHGLGIPVLIVTNAAGGIKKSLSPGDFMAITDHINLTGEDPLIGFEGGRSTMSPFVDMTFAYDPDLIRLARSVGRKTGIKVADGVLAAVKGPSYETPAEIRMLKGLGADAVCMSTVHEVIMARYLGLKVLGISLITNYAAGISQERLTHQSVLEVAGKNRERFERLITGIVSKIPV